MTAWWLKLAFGALLGVVLCIAAFLLYHILDTELRRKKLRHFPVPRGALPFLGHAVAVATHPLPWELMQKWCDDLHSDLVRWYMPMEDWIVIRGGDAMKAVFQTKFKDFHKEMAMSFHPFLCILGTGLVTSHGELWQQQRKLMTPAFKGDILEHVIGISLRAVSRLDVKLAEHIRGRSTVEIDEEFRLLTLQVITEALMSLPHNESDRVFPKLYLPIMEECHKRVFARWRPWIPSRAWWQHRSRVRQLDRYICDLIRQRWHDVACSKLNGEHRDLLDLILVGKQAAGEQWSSALQRQLCYELKTFLLAGHETSAAMLTFTMLELLSNPQMASRVLEEADAVLGPDSSRVPSKQEVEGGMQYTMACLQETLRKYTVVPVVTRIAQRDTEICGHAIPRGAKVVIHMHATHDKWDDPSSYRPERFLPGGEFEKFPEGIQRFMFVPFGQGPRVCIGQHFSLMESRVVIAALLQRYRFTLERPRKLEWVSNIIPLQPVGGVPLAVAAR